MEKGVPPFRFLRIDKLSEIVDNLPNCNERESSSFSAFQRAFGGWKGAAGANEVHPGAAGLNGVGPARSAGYSVGMRAVPPAPAGAC